MIIGGFAESPLRLNQGIAAVPKWDKAAILDRAEKLASLALTVWIAPKLPPEMLDTYRTKTSPTNTVYTIKDHPHLESGQMRPLFDEFREQVLALAPFVTEEFLKLYVAYKAETNSVNVVPQAKRLRLSLKLAFPEINGPKGICKDVTGLGRWGNGNVEVRLSSQDNLPYVLGLVRQVFEKQMGDGE